MTNVNATELAERYFSTWETIDEPERAELAAQVFAKDAVHKAAPAGVSFTGLDEIVQNISRVNRENIQQAGLSFSRGAVVPNDDAVLVRWSGQAPNGQTVGTGADVLVLNAEGLVQTLYMFNGQ